MHEKTHWTPLPASRRADLLSKLPPFGFEPTADTTTVEETAPPFYERATLLRLRDPHWSPSALSVFFLALDGDLHRLDGTAPPIHDINARAPIRLDETNALDYLHFFCFFVRGEEGPFLIVESLSNPGMPPQLDEPTRQTFERHLRPARLTGVDADGRLRADAVVFYSNALFGASFAIDSSGMVEMRDDEPLVADLPVKVQAPIA